MRSTDHARQRPVFGVTIAAALNLVLLAPGLGGAETNQTVEAQPDPELGSIGVTVKVKGPVKLSATFTADEVFFVKLEEGTAVFSATTVIPSNYSKKGQVFLLNAEPGRYVAVAARSEPRTKGGRGFHGTSYQEFFSMAMIQGTEVTVEAGEPVFMGEIKGKASALDMNSADAAQTHYLQIISPKPEGGFFKRWMRGDTDLISYPAELVSVARDRAFEQQFWTTARDKAFKNLPAWQREASARLQAIDRVPADDG